MCLADDSQLRNHCKRLTFYARYRELQDLPNVACKISIEQHLTDLDKVGR